MELLKEFFANFISRPYGDARKKWLLGDANLRKLRVRALHVKPLEVRKGDKTHPDVRTPSTTADVLAPVPGVSITDAEEETDVTSLETRHEMDQLNAADENRGSILEAENELAEKHQPAEIDNALSSLVDTKIARKFGKQDGMHAQWEKPEEGPHSNRHFAKASDAPWCYSDVYEQASSRPEYDSSAADTDAYVARYGSSYNLYLDGPHPRLLKGFSASYGTVKIFAPNIKPLTDVEEITSPGDGAKGTVRAARAVRAGGQRGAGQRTSSSSST